MKILFTHSSIIYKGGWGRIFPLAEGLVKMGNEVTILTMTNKLSITIRKKIINGVRVVVFPSIIPKKNYYDPIAIFLKILYVLFHKYDIVHSDIGQRPQSGLPCRLSKKLKGTTYISEWMDSNGKEGQYKTKSKLFKVFLGYYELKWEYKDRQYADGVVVLANPLFKKALEIRNDNSVIKIHGGAMVDKVPYFEDNSLFKEKIGLGKDIITFGYIDASINIKEVQYLMDAIIELDICEKVKILLFGGNSRTQYNFNEKISQCILNLGWVDFYIEYEKILAVDSFVLLKEDTYEATAGWPNAIGDYLTCGRPIIITPVGETVEFVDTYPDGFYIAERNKESLMDIINSILNDKQRALSMGRINRQIAEDLISWRKKSRDLFDFYLKIKENKALIMIK